MHTDRALIAVCHHPRASAFHLAHITPWRNVDLDGTALSCRAIPGGEGRRRFDRAVDLRIMRIRRKIEPDPTRPAVIRTIRGGGYLFSPAEKA